MYTKTAALPIRSVPPFKRTRKTLTSIDEQKVYNYTRQLQLPTEEDDLQLSKILQRRVTAFVQKSLFKGVYFARNFRKEHFEKQKRSI
jgi:hypothetical protein